MKWIKAAQRLPGFHPIEGWKKEYVYRYKVTPEGGGRQTSMIITTHGGSHMIKHALNSETNGNVTNVDVEWLDETESLPGKEEGWISVHAELVTTFENFSQWVNNASNTIGRYPGTEQIICVDKNGNTSTGGQDFMCARDNHYFPVKAYRLIRSIESVPFDSSKTK